MKLNKMSGIGLFLLGTSFIFSCNGGGGGDFNESGTGKLALELADSPTEKYQAVYIIVDRINIKNNLASIDDKSSWKFVENPQEKYIPLNLVNGMAAVLGEVELVPQRYNHILQMLGKTSESKNKIFGDPDPYTCYLILNDSDRDTVTIKALKVPNDYHTEVKLFY